MPRTFEVPFRVYWSECDPAGIMYFANYMQHFEKAEEDFFLALGGGSRQNLLDRYGVWLPRVEAHSRFFGPARMDDELVIIVSLREMRDKAITFDFRVRRPGGEVITEASYTVVCVDAKEFKARSLPQPVKELLSAWL